MFGKRIKDFGNHFTDRLDQDLLNGALDYVKFNEETLSLDILCDHLSEYDIPITQKEYDEVSSLIKDMGLNESESPYKYLQELIK